MCVGGSLSVQLVDSLLFTVFALRSCAIARRILFLFRLNVLIINSVVLKEKNVRTENSHQVVIEKYSYRTFYNFFPNEDERAVHRTVRQSKIIFSVRSLEKN